jgi:hypothetical protein
MRGGRSFLILLIVAVGLGAYVYFVESKKDLTDTTATKKDKVFAVDSSKIEQIDVTASSGATTTLKKSGADWQIVAPEKIPADATQVGSLVSTLESLEVGRVIEDKPSSAAPFSLEPPRFSVAFKLTGEGLTRRLLVGSKTVNGSDLYARIEGQPRVFLIGGFVEDSLNRTTFDLRDKSVLKFARDGVDLLTLEVPGAPALSLAKKGSEWRLTAPVDAKADASAVDTSIGRISQAQMKSVIPPSSGTESAAQGSANPSPADLKKYGLDKPQVVATVGVGSTRATIAIGAKHDDTTLYARDLSRPLVFTVDKTLLDDLNHKADDLRAKDVFEFRAFTAVSLEITRAGQTFTFAKQKTASRDSSAPAETWKLTQPAAKDVNQTAMTDLLTGLSNLRADKFTDHALTSGDEIQLTAKFGDETSPKTERVTFRESGGVVHALRQGEPGAAIVVTADFDKAIATFKELAGIK